METRIRELQETQQKLWETTLRSQELTTLVLGGKVESPEQITSDLVWVLRAVLIPLLAAERGDTAWFLEKAEHVTRFTELAKSFLANATTGLPVLAEIGAFLRENCGRLTPGSALDERPTPDLPLLSQFSELMFDFLQVANVLRSGELWWLVV